MRRSVVLLVVLLFTAIAAYSASLQLVSPKGGESYKAGKEVMIRWKADGIKGNITLELIKNGAYFGTIAKMPAAYGSYRWKAGSTVGNKAASGDFFIKIISEGRKYTDSTKSYFTVSGRFSSKKPFSMKPAVTLKTPAKPAPSKAYDLRQHRTSSRKPALSKAYDLRQYRTPSRKPTLSRALTARFNTMRPMVDAYKNAIKSPAAGRAALRGIIALLKKTGPMGYMNGYWVAVVDMKPIYALPEVGRAMRSSMTGSENTRFSSLIKSRDKLDSVANAQLIFIRAKKARSIGLTQKYGFHHDIINDPQMGSFDSLGFINSMRDMANLDAPDNVGGGMGGGSGWDSVIEAGATVIGVWLGGMIGGPAGALLGGAIASGVVALVNWVKDEGIPALGDAWTALKDFLFGDDEEEDDEEEDDDSSSTGVWSPELEEGWETGGLESSAGIKSFIAVKARTKHQDLMMGLAGAYIVIDSMIRNGQKTTNTVRSTQGKNVIMAF